MSATVKSLFGTILSFGNYNDGTVATHVHTDKGDHHAWIFNGQELADALAAEGFVGKVRTVRDALAEMPEGTRFKFAQSANIYVRQAGNAYSPRGMSIHLDVNETRLDWSIGEILPEPPKGDEMVRLLTGGTMFTADGEPFVRTAGATSVSLTDGYSRLHSYFANKKVEVSN